MLLMQPVPTGCMTSKRQYLMRTAPNTSEYFAPLEDALRQDLIPVITGRLSITDDERKLLALPCHLGGMELINPTEIAEEQYRSSCDITTPLVSLILEMKYEIPEDLDNEMKHRQREIEREEEMTSRGVCCQPTDGW